MSENCNLIANRGLPLINEHIFSFLDDWSVTQCRGVCQDWKEFIDVYYSKFFYRRLRKRCENDEQFLNSCAMEGFLYVFKVFTRNFENISEINPRDDEGWTPLHCAVSYGHEDLVRLLLKFVKNKHPKVKSDGYSPLHLCSKEGFLFIAKCFFETKKLVKLPKDKQGKTPLHMAASKDQRGFVQFLLENIEEKCPKDKSGLTPLHSAAENGHFEIIKLLMDNLTEKNPEDQHGFTPLHKAAEKGYLKIVEYIMEFIDDKNPKNPNNWTPLHEAAYNGHLSVVKYIMSNVSGNKNPESNGKWTPLKYAAYKGHTEIVDYITKVISVKEENNNMLIRTRSQKRALEIIKNVTSKSGQKSKKKKNY